MAEGVFLTVDKRVKKAELIETCFHCKISSFSDTMVYYDGLYFHKGDCLIRYQQKVKENKALLNEIVTKLAQGPISPQEFSWYKDRIFPKDES